MFRRFLIRTLLLGMLPGMALAITLPTLPPGMCALDSTIAAQKMMLDYLQKATPAGNHFISGFARCDELDAATAHGNAPVSHYGSILTQDLGDSSAIDRKTYVDAAAESFSGTSHALMDEALTDARQSAANSTKDPALTDPQAITSAGPKILFRNDDMIIIGLTQTNQYRGTSNRIASVAALTLVNGTPMSVNLYAPASETTAFQTASVALQSIVAKIITANQ